MNMKQNIHFIIIIIINPLTARVVGAPDDFATSFLHFSLFSTALWDLLNSRPVHSLMLSSHLFLCPPCLLPPFTVPCKMVFARPDERETTIPLQFASFYDRQEIFTWSNCLLIWSVSVLVTNSNSTKWRQDHSCRLPSIGTDMTNLKIVIICYGTNSQSCWDPRLPTPHPHPTQLIPDRCHSVSSCSVASLCFDKGSILECPPPSSPLVSHPIFLHYFHLFQNPLRLIESCCLPW